MRGAKRKGTRYFGPYAHAWAIRETLDLALRVFPVRTCSRRGVQARRPGRPALPARLHRQVQRAVRRAGSTPSAHREIAEDFCDFMAGETGRFLGAARPREMKEAAAELDFERAARLRDDIGALERVLEKSAVVLPDATDADVFALAEDELEVAVQLFHVRGGRVRGQRGWVAERDAETTPEVVEHLLQQVYGGEAGDAVPREVLVPVLPDDAEALAEWLCGPARQPGRPAGARAAATSAPSWRPSPATPSQSLARHKVARAGDLTTRSQALQQLQDALELDEAPLRIECFDISHVQGTQVVGSMVVFEDGLPRKSEYRRFIVRGDETGATDDTAAMHEVLTRRFRRGRREEADARWRGSGARGDAGVPHADGPSPEVGARPRPVRLPRPTSSSSTAACPRSTPPPAHSRTAGSSTSRSSASPSASRRSGCRGRSSPWSCPARARASTSCSGCATRRTGSPSPSTGSGGPRR